MPKNAQNPKMPQNHQKITMVNEISRGFWHCLKRERDIGSKAMLSDFKTALTFSSALILSFVQ